MTEGGFGGARGDRTPDLYNAIVALSLLSYGPTRETAMLPAPLAYFNPARRNRSVACSGPIS